MNLLEQYQQHLWANDFNNAKIRDFISVNGYGFDIRIVRNKVYCYGLEVDHFIDELMVEPAEQMEFKNAINKWEITNRAISEGSPMLNHPCL